MIVRNREIFVNTRFFLATSIQLVRIVYYYHDKYIVVRKICNKSKLTNTYLYTIVYSIEYLSFEEN